MKVRDRELATAAQRRLEVKIRTRKLLHTTSESKQARAKAGAEIVKKLDRLNSVEDGAADEGAEEQGEDEEEVGRDGLESDAPLLNKNFSHYSTEVDMGQGAPKPKPELSSRERKSASPRVKSAGLKRSTNPSPTSVGSRVSNGSGEVGENDQSSDAPMAAKEEQEEVAPPPTFVHAAEPMSEAGQARMEAARKKRLEAAAAAPPKEPKQDYKPYLTGADDPTSPGGKTRKPKPSARGKAPPPRPKAGQ